MGKLRYVNLAMNECLRHYPPVPIIGRTCIKPIKLPNTDHYIPKNVHTYIHTYTHTHHIHIHMHIIHVLSFSVCLFVASLLTYAFLSPSCLSQTVVLFPPYVVHHDPKLWKDPNTVRPTRFEEKYNKFAFIPFNIGQRNCIGMYVCMYMYVCMQKLIVQ